MEHTSTTVPLDTRSAALLVGVAAKTMENWRVLGLGPKFIKANRAVRYDPRDIEAWKNANKLGSTSEVAAA